MEGRTHFVRGKTEDYPAYRPREISSARPGGRCGLPNSKSYTWRANEIAVENILISRKVPTKLCYNWDGSRGTLDGQNGVSRPVRERSQQGRLGLPQLDHLLHQLQLLQLWLHWISDLLKSSRPKIFCRLDHSLNLPGRFCAHGRGSPTTGGAGEQLENGGRLPSVRQLPGTFPKCRTVFQVYIVSAKRKSALNSNANSCVFQNPSNGEEANDTKSFRYLLNL